ncbi:MAG: hypothetical protein MRY74_07155 [Neomegalonema sp.]|nr:hypothetical protein [Neomegalonema sp.]
MARKRQRLRGAQLTAVAALCFCTDAVGQTKREESPPVQFFAGRYALIGAAGAGPAYRGGATITVIDKRTLRAARVIGAVKTVELGRIEKTRFNTPVIRWFAADSSGKALKPMIGSCHFKVDLANYPMLLCTRAPIDGGAYGYETFFPLDGSAQAQRKAFGFSD